VRYSALSNIDQSAEDQDGRNLQNTRLIML
jgi:hypothetical protein